MTGEVEFFQ